jgi:hypothetical protein
VASHVSVSRVSSYWLHSRIPWGWNVSFFNFFYGLLHNCCSQFYSVNNFVAAYTYTYCFHSSTVELPSNVPQYKVHFQSLISILYLLHLVAPSFMFQFTHPWRNLESGFHCIWLYVLSYAFWTTCFYARVIITCNLLHFLRACFFLVRHQLHMGANEFHILAQECATEIVS